VGRELRVLQAFQKGVGKGKKGRENKRTRPKEKGKENNRKRNTAFQRKKQRRRRTKEDGFVQKDQAPKKD